MDPARLLSTNTAGSHTVEAPGIDASAVSLVGRVWRVATGPQGALIAFVTYVTVALPVTVFGIGRHRWFFGDEWSFLAEREAGDFGDLFRSHAEHWSTLPVLAYRALWNLFGLRTYVPYLAVVVVAHLATAVLLRVVMVRAGVRPWTATVVAGGFVLFGPGQENMLWAFQIGFVGALLFGLVQLVLSDHDGPIDRRDLIGLLAGLASLMCSGVSLIMVATVGLATLVRRGPKIAAFHVLPLAALYALWYTTTSPGGIDNPYHRAATPRELTRFVWSGVRGNFTALGGFVVIAWLLAAVVAVGALLAWRSRHGSQRHGLAAPGAMLVGSVAFLVGTGFTRWFVTPLAGSQSRYVYTVAALSLPAFAVAVDAVIGRWRVLAPFVLGAFVIAAANNATKFGGGIFSADYFAREKQLAFALARAPEGADVPAYVRPNVWYTIGWLRAAAADGDVPDGDPMTPALARHVRFLLSVTQVDRDVPSTNCRAEPNEVIVRPSKGERFGFRFARQPAVGVSWFQQDSLVVTLLGAERQALDTSTFKREFGGGIEIERDGMTLRLRAGDPHQPLVLCSRR